jgi:hypothetical protein
VADRQTAEHRNTEIREVIEEYIDRGPLSALWLG